MSAATSIASSPATSTTARPSPAFRSTLIRIYANHRDEMFATAARILVSHADADDAVQDAFLAVLESPPRETNERTLTAALDGALRIACGQKVQERSQDERARVALARRGV